jgi:acyl carrier protein
MTITKTEIRTLLLERHLFQTASETLADDSEIALDSLSLAWFLSGLQSRHGIVLQLDDEDWSEFRSVDGIHRLLLRKEAAKEGAKPG